MTEPTPRDLRRLEKLEERLSKAQAERKDLLGERRELRAKTVAQDRRLRALEQERTDAGARLDSVLEHNKALSSRLDELTGDLERIGQASEELKRRTESAEGRLASAESALEQALNARKVAERDAAGARRSLAMAQQQLEEKSIPAVIEPAEVATLLDKLVADLGAGRRLAVREGEMRLKVAFGKVGDSAGFVLPSGNSPTELNEKLQELSLRFDRPPPDAPSAR